MKTIFKLKTWGCECGYHTDREHIGLCPACGNHELKRENNPEKKLEVTIIGKDEIRDEVSNIKERSKQDKSHAVFNLSTQKEENQYTKDRELELVENIERNRLMEDSVLS